MAFIRNINSSLPDDELVEQYRSTGNMNTLSDLYQRYMELVYGVCLKYLRNPEEAQDCVINIFEELIVKLKKYHVGHFKAWLYQLAKNHCLMKIRSKKNLPRQVDHEFVYLDDNAHPDNMLEKELHFERMEYCIEQLVNEQKKMIELFYLQEKSYKSIVVMTGFDLNKVRSFIQNGRRNLKICMEKKALENIQ